jgi:hypothetical protein
MSKHAAPLLILTLLITAAAGTTLVNLGKANPTIISDNLGTIPPDSETKPPVLSILTPENQTIHSTKTIFFTLNVSVGESPTASSKYIGEIHYKTDWQNSNTSIYEYNPTADPYSTEPVITQFSKTLNLTGMPDGNHRLTVYAEERGAYYDHTVYDGNVWYQYYYLFEINGSSSVFFTVDTTSPTVSVLSLQDKVFYSSSVDLNFFVDEPTSRCAYGLDGNGNVTVAGNTTLTGLTVGKHDLKLYVWDAAGHTGSSETISFTVAEPFPTTLLIVSLIAVVAVVGLGLLVYLKKRHRLKTD